MRVKGILAFLLFSAACWGQNGYTTNYTWGVSDLSSLMSTTNLLYPIKNTQTPQAWGLCNGVPAIGADVTPVCVSNGTPTPSSANTVWYFDSGTYTWTQITGLGSGWLGVASVNVNNLYLLKPASSCTSFGGYGIFHWNGSTATQIGGCATQIHAQEDGGVLATNTAHTPSQIYYLPVGSSTWGYAGNDQSSGWTYASGANVNDFCGVKNGAIYTYSSDDSDGVPGAWTQLTVTPPAMSSVVYTCEIANDPNSGLVMFATYRTTNNHGQYITAFAFFDFSTGAWTAIKLPAAGIMSAASIGKWPTVILDSNGYIYHFNVYGIYHAATITGSVNQCPPPNPCNPSGVTHNGVVRATLPGGLYGAQATGNYAPSANMNITSYDISATAIGCDGLFGNPQQCAPTDTGSVQCSQSGFLFSGTPSNGEPPEPQVHWTEYVGGFDQFFSTIKTYPYTEDGRTGYIAVSIAGYTDNACQPGTYSACAPPYGGDSVTITTACQDIQGRSCVPADAIAKGRYEAKTHTKALGTVWGAFFNYSKGMTASCDRVTVYNEKVYTPCF